MFNAQVIKLPNHDRSFAGFGYNDIVDTVRGTASIIVDNLPADEKEKAQKILNPVNQVLDAVKTINFKSIKFPESKEEWQAIGERIKAELERQGKAITLDDAVALAKQGLQATGRNEASPQNPKTPTKETLQNAGDFMDTVANDKRYWFGILILILLLRP